MALRTTVEFHDDELAAFLPSRLAIANGFSSVNLLYACTGIRETALKSGGEKSISLLSRWSAIEKTRLTKTTIQAEKQRHWWLGKARFQMSGRIGSLHRFCAECVVNDLEHGIGPRDSRPYLRATWLTRDIRNCDIHQRPITQVAFNKELGRDFNRFVKLHLEEIIAEAKQPLRVSSTQLDTYLKGRINGIVSNTFLDGLDAFLVAGLAHNFGFLVKWRRVAPEMTHEEIQDMQTGEIGFRIISGGETSIRAALSHMINTIVPDLTDGGFIGRMGNWFENHLENNPSLLPIAEFINDEVARNMPLGVGDLCVLPVKKRYLHSISTAQIEYGIHRSRIRKLISQHGLFTHENKTSGRSYFDAEKGGAILHDASRLLNTVQVQELLGVSTTVLSKLTEFGLLKTAEISGSNRKFSRYRPEEITSFLERLFENARSGDDEGLKPLEYFYSKYLVSAEVLIGLIFDRTLSRVGRIQNKGMKISSILLDPAEVDTVLRSRRIAGQSKEAATALPRAEVAASLHHSLETVDNLIKLGALTTISAIDSTTNRKCTRVTAISLKNFEAKYISASALAKQRKTRVEKINILLSKNGIAAAIQATKRTTSYYLREDVAKLKMFDV